jgi:DNA excision repair protein ERCC-4
LLIELEENKPFSLASYNEGLGGDIDFKSTMSKLVLLTLHFPKLRIFWCNTPHATAKLFYEMKQSGAEPDAATASAIGADAPGELLESKYAPEPEAVLRKIPGVTAANALRIMDSVANLRELAGLPLEQCQKLCGQQNGRILHSFLHNV